MTRVIVTNDAMARAIFETRKAYGLSQIELAERAGLHEKHVYLCEKGRTAITIRTLVRCDKVLGGELIAKLIKGEDDE